MNERIHSFQRIVLSVALCLGVVVSQLAFATELHVQMTGEAANQCVGTGSTATGSGLLTYDAATRRLTHRMSMANLRNRETGAHIHGPAPECTNAGIVFDLPPGSPKSGEFQLSPDQVRNLLSDLYYVNIHTDAFPDGEIRGQILLQPETTTVFGFPHTTLGRAIFSQNAEGGLVVSNIGSSGLDGVRTDFGEEVQGWEGAYDFGLVESLPQGFSARWTDLPDPVLTPGPSYSLTMTKGPTGLLEFSADADDPTLFPERVDLFLHGELVDSVELSAPAQAPLLTAELGGQKGELTIGMRPSLTGEHLLASMEFPQPVLMTLPSSPTGGDVTSLATRYTMFLPDGTPVRAKVSLSLSAPSTGGPSEREVIVKGKKILQNFIESNGAGDAQVAGLRGGGLVVSNIGSSGLDGVRFIAPDEPNEDETVEEMGVRFDPLVLDLSGSGIVVQAGGSTVGTGQVTEVLERIGITNTAPGTLSFDLDYGALGTDSVLAAGAIDGQIQGTLTVSSGAILTAAATDGTPVVRDIRLFRSLDAGTDSGPGTQICFDNTVTLSLNDGRPGVQCECVHLIANNPMPEVGEYHGFTLRANDTGTITVADASILKTGSYFGLESQTTGVAVRGWDPVKKEEIVGNIGSSGLDGVRVNLGDGAEGYSFKYRFPEDGEMPDGMTVKIDLQPVNDPPTLTVPTMQLRGGKNRLDGLSMWTSGAPVDTGQVTVTAIDDGLVVGEWTFTPPIPDPLVVGDFGSSDGTSPTVYYGDKRAPININTAGGGAGRTGNCCRTLWVWGGETPRLFEFGTVEADRETVRCNRINVLYEDDGNQGENPLYEKAGLSFMGGDPDRPIILGRSSGVLFQNDHDAQGGADYVFQNNVTDLQFLRVSNLGSSGCDGVSISPPPPDGGDQLQSERFSMRTRINELENKLQSIGFLVSMDPGSGGLPPDPLSEISSLQLTLEPAAGGYRGNVGPIRWMSPEALLRAEAYSGGSRVGSAEALITELSFSTVVPQTAGTYVFELIVNDGSTSTLPDGVQHTLLWDASIDLVLQGQAPVSADELRLIATDSGGTSGGAGGMKVDFDIQSVVLTVAADGPDVTIDILDEEFGFVDLAPSSGVGPFVRGDANGDGNVNIADPSFIANFLFGVPPATPPPCDAAMDANGDGSGNIADPSYIANFLFGVGPATPPPAPYPTCATDPNETQSCDNTQGCDP